MGGATSGANRALAIVQDAVEFGRIVVVGGGCYGSYYVRQLGRAAAANAVVWSDLIVVDRDPACRVARLSSAERPPQLHIETASWEEFFARFLGEASRDPDAAAGDAIVPSPLMPHLLGEWLQARARQRWPDRAVAVAPLGTVPAIPWQMTGTDHTHFVSFAEWICPINCVEPARCPATKGARSWSLPVALAAYVEDETAAGRALAGPFVLHCSHRAYGVGMIDVGEVIAADAAIAQRATHSAASFLVGTTSHCHGALQRIDVGAPVALAG